MKGLLRIAIGGVVVAGVSTVAVSDYATGFTTIGGSLSQNQRDFRVYDNWSASGLHQNPNDHVNYPDYNEVFLAGWKAGVEWNSRNVVDGTGDPTQLRLGTGFANFDFFWNGEANGIGNNNANIISQIAGGSGGVIAFMEGPISDGWRIRGYQNWNWKDGPGNEGSMDFQAVMCHELGHALGLGHSSSGGATMFASTSGGVSPRSIESDDQAGVQFIYGARDDAVKPWIDTVGGSTVPGGTMVVTGGNFSTNGNVAWFNNSLLNAAQTGGDAFKTSGFSSTAGGTQVSFTVPTSGIESGHFLVKKNLSGHKSLSDVDVWDGGGPPPTDLFDLAIDDSTPNVGQNVTLDITNADANSPCWIYYSTQNTGTTINGQPFDIGANFKTLITGTTDGAGAFSFSSNVPNKAGGKTFYLEARVDNGGATKDSNLITVVVS